MEYQECNLNEPFLAPLLQIEPGERPQCLWYQGEIPKKENRKVVAIVGSRRSTTYGEDIAYKIAYNLAKMGVIIVSGLAYGIDSCAHRGCLDAGGITVAVLGTPIDKIYPRSN